MPNKKIDKEKIKNFINQYLNLCFKYHLCIATPYEDFTVTSIEDYDYYEFNDGITEPILVYPHIFIKSIENNLKESLYNAE